ncbi:MAG TPA: Mov34/MPN/PAD-1 family protein [Polyangia bacterium]|jgi:adenylyltransferase/sulfurtransferase|nr:Mov34/MPN/PAD-1 family protein [Polyangia bacterium]
MSGEPLLPPALLADIYAHAAAGYPEEVCGFILGPKDGPLDEVRRCENRQNALHAEDPKTFPRDARTAYNIGPTDLLFLTKSQRGGRPVRIIYHSHVNVGAYFSAEDRQAATFDGEPLYPVDYLVVDIQQDGAHGAKLFRFQAGDFVEIAAFPALT